MGDDRPGRTSGGSSRQRDAGKLAQLIESFPAELQQEFREIWRPLEVARGEVLLDEGEEATQTGYVTDGLLGMIKELPDGRRHIVGLLTPTDMYGRAFEGPLGYRIEALVDSTVQVCDGARLEEILDRSPEAEHLFLVNLVDEIDAAREWMLVLSWPKVVQRVASFLLILCRRKLHEHDVVAGSTRHATVNLQIAIQRSDLAQYLGARPESLSRAFRELDDEGIIRMNNPYNFDVLDLDRLVDMAGDDQILDDDRR